jgi:hypothetical protein
VGTHAAVRVALGLALLLGSAGSFAVAARAASALVSGTALHAAQGVDGLTLFRPLMPALTSPRCVNCHGGTDPLTGENHGGGAVSNTDAASAVCLECHTAGTSVVRGVTRGPWEAVSGIKFDDQVVPMCETMSHLVQVLGPSTFVSFLAADPVVGLGFDGLRGMDERSPFWPVEADPPPMDRTDFVAAAQRWVTEGRAECGSHGWSGSIVQTTSLRSVSPGNDLATDLTITVSVTGGQATAVVHMVGHTIQDGATVNGCQTYNHETFSADGTVPAMVEIVVSPPLSPDDMPEMPPGFALPPDVPDPRQGGFVITFGVPQLVRGAHHIETQSVSPPPRSACQHTVQDPPYSYAARGGTIMKPLGAEQPDHLVGTDTVTAGGSTVTTTWDLTLD